MQVVLPLDNESAIKVTTATYTTPNNKTIQANGVKPDIIIPMLHIKKNDDFDLRKIMHENNLTDHLGNHNTSINSNGFDMLKRLSIISSIGFAKRRSKLQGLITMKILKVPFIILSVLFTTSVLANNDIVLFANHSSAEMFNYHKYDYKHSMHNLKEKFSPTAWKNFIKLS